MKITRSEFKAVYNSKKNMQCSCQFMYFHVIGKVLLHAFSKFEIHPLDTKFLYPVKQWRNKFWYLCCMSKYYYTTNIYMNMA